MEKYICHGVFNIPAHRIPNLTLKIRQVEVVKPMQLDKLTVIADSEAHCAPDGYRNSEVEKSRIVYIKERNAEFNLNNVCKIDEVYFCLKRCASGVSETGDTCKDREIACFNFLVKRSNDKVLHRAVALAIHKYSNLAGLNPQRRAPTDRIFTVVVLCNRACRMPFPDEV